MNATPTQDDTGPPPASVVPLKRFRAHAGTIAKRVQNTGETVVISNHGNPIAAIVPIPQRTDTPDPTPDGSTEPPAPVRLRRPDPDDDPTPAAA